MSFSRVYIKALIAVLPLIIIGCGSDRASNLPAPHPVSTPTATVAAPTTTDSQDLAQRLTTLCAIMNLGAALNASALDDLFISDPNYGTSNGLTRAEDIASIVAIFGPNGTNTNGRLKSIENVQIVSDQTANYADRGVSKAYLLNYDFVFENGTVVHGNDVTFGKELNSGQWKFIGAPNGADLGNNYGSELTLESAPAPQAIVDPPELPSVTLTAQ